MSTAQLAPPATTRTLHWRASCGTALGAHPTWASCANNTCQYQRTASSTCGYFGWKLQKSKDSPSCDFATCPLHSLAVALAMQAAPCAALLSQLPELVTATAEPLQSGVPLHDLLAADPGSLSIALTTSSPAAPASTSQPAAVAPPSLAPARAQEQVSGTTVSSAPPSGEKTRGGDGVQAYVNRLLKRVAKPAGATTDLTSHSFRRGGAQHANGNDRLAPQWIFDRGAWDMSKLNKGFAYVYNTPREDRKVARVLSGWDADAAPVVLDVAVLDHGAQEQLGRLRGFVFSTCTGLKEQRLNVSSKVLTVLTAYLVRYYPQLKEISPTAPIVARMDECLVAADIPHADLLAWSVALHETASTPAQAQEQDTNKHQCRCQQTDPLLAVIRELIASNKNMAARLTILEAAQLTSTNKAARTEDEQVEATSAQQSKPKRRKKQVTYLSAAWFEWYTRVPRVWDCSNMQKKSESRYIVAFMKLFIPDGFILDAGSNTYKDDVLAVGTRAEKAVLQFLASRRINAKGAGSVLRALRPLHKSNALDERIVAYKHLLAIGRISDPSPADSQDILSLAGHV